MQIAGFTRRVLLTLSVAGVLSLPGLAQDEPCPGDGFCKAGTEEWVYRIRYGFNDEWFQIFRKYQLAILDRQKQHDAPPGQSEGEFGKQLFPDQAAFNQDEKRRWELTTNHWDLPIHQLDLHQPELVAGNHESDSE